MALYPKANRYQYRGNTRTVHPVAEPVSLTEVETHLRLSNVTGDELIYLNELVLESVAELEDLTGLGFTTQTWKLTLDNWPGGGEQWWDGMRQGHIDEVYAGGGKGWVTLPRHPLQSIESVTVYDEDGTSSAVTIADIFDIDTQQIRGRMALKSGASWPVALRRTNAIEIVYKVGFGDNANDVPTPIRRAIRQMVGYLYEHRGDGCDPGDALRDSGARAILDRYRDMSI